VDLLPRAYNAGRKLLPIDITETAVFVFKDRSRFDAFTRVHSGQRLPAGVIAASSNGILLFCQYDAQGLQSVPDTTSDMFRGTVAHEYTHCLLQRAMGTVELPLWLDEGLAMVAGSELAPHDLQRNDYAIHRLLEKNAVMSLDELGKFYESVEHGLRKGEGKTDPYQQGFHMTRYFLSRIKPAELPAFLNLVLKTGSLETAFRRNQGMTLASFYNSWLHHAESTTRLTATVTRP
jgi:hypothetical protein